MDTPFIFHESDGQRYRQKLAHWPEACMERLNGGYIARLSDSEPVSGKFRALCGLALSASAANRKAEAAWCPTQFQIMRDYPACFGIQA